jgi:hypothetical protein
MGVPSELRTMYFPEKVYSVTASGNFLGDYVN